MDLYRVEIDSADFNPQLYLKILVAIAKADRYNAEPERAFVQRRALWLSLDFDDFWNRVDKDFSIDTLRVSRLTALVVIRDCIMLASLDGNYSLDEKEKVFAYAQKMDIPRTHVKALEKWLEAQAQLKTRWERLVAGEVDESDWV